MLSDIFFLKQKTAYEMLISDWSSDVCSSDLVAVIVAEIDRDLGRERAVGKAAAVDLAAHLPQPERARGQPHLAVEILGRARGDDVDRAGEVVLAEQQDRKSTRLNSSH